MNYFLILVKFFQNTLAIMNLQYLKMMYYKFNMILVMEDKHY